LRACLLERGKAYRPFFVALPIVITALSQTAAKYMKGRRRHSFTFAGKELIIDVP
jgi:hypothetical protein